MAKHPKLEVQIRYSTSLADFARDGIDVGIRWGRGSWPGLTAELIGRSALVAAASPAYVAELQLVQRADLARATLLHEETRADWMEWLAAAGLDRWMTVSERISELFFKADSVNTDRKQTVVVSFLAMQSAMR